MNGQERAIEAYARAQRARARDIKDDLGKVLERLDRMITVPSPEMYLAYPTYLVETGVHITKVIHFRYARKKDLIRVTQDKKKPNKFHLYKVTCWDEASCVVGSPGKMLTQHIMVRPKYTEGLFPTDAEWAALEKLLGFELKKP